MRIVAGLTVPPIAGTLLILAVAGCGQDDLHGPTDEREASGDIHQAVAAGDHDGLGSDPDSLAAVMIEQAELGKIEEATLLVAVKSPGADPVGPAAVEGNEVIGVPFAPTGVERRETSGFPTHVSEDKTSVATLLAETGAQRVRPLNAFPVVVTRVPWTRRALAATLARLLRNPHVAWVEASRRSTVEFLRPAEHEPGALGVLAPPQGSNDTDVKHDSMVVEPAWDETRGSGAKLAIFDTGVTTGHPDLQELAGFKGTADAYGGCDDSNQSVAGCNSADDHGHGTWMVGLAGADDNDIETVGVAPEASVYSVKVAANCNVATYCDGDEFEIEDDDLVAAFDWAAGEGIEVISMSFGADVGFTVEATMENLYDNHDVLLVAAVPNEGQNVSEDIVEESEVLGVSAFMSDGSAWGEGSDHDEVAGYPGNGTESPGADCPDGSFCNPGFPVTFGDDNASAGTSGATASVSAIAALVRSAIPEWSNEQVRSRIVSTANASFQGGTPHVSAEEAVFGDPLGVQIEGKTDPPPTSYCSYSTILQGGTGPYSYVWEKDGVQIGTGPGVAVFVGSTSFDLTVVVTDRWGNQASAGTVVRPDPNTTERRC